MSVTLRAGDLTATVGADAFLSIGSLRHGDVELLAGPGDIPARYAVHGRAAGITLLHPWANRLRADRFTAAGATVEAGDDDGLGRDAAGLPIHGLAAPPGAWRLEPGGGSSVRARLEHPCSPAFPFAHLVEVDVELLPAGVTVATRMRATTDSPVPLLVGWHPYFRLPGPREHWRLSLPSRRHLALDDLGLPAGTETAEPAEDAPLGARTFDDSYGGLAEGSALAIAGGGHELRVTLTAGFGHAQVFAPADADVVSLEPMTAPVDAYASAEPLPLVLDATVRFAVGVAGSVAAR